MPRGIESISWTVRPLKERPMTVAAIFFVACIGFGIGVAFFSRPLMGLLGFAMILGSTMDHWLGSSYSVDSRGARCRVGPSVTELRWENLRRVLFSDRTIKLSPLETTGRLDAFRGVILRTTPVNHDQVMEFVRKHGPEGVVFEPVGSEAS